MSTNSLSANIEQRQTQEQRLSRQQLMMLQLLECTDQTLQQRIDQEVQKNPALDAEAYTNGETSSCDTETADVDTDSYSEDVNTEREDYGYESLSPDEIEDVMQDDDGCYESMDSVRVANHNSDATPQYESVESACDYLKHQLHFRNLHDTQLQLCEYLVDCLDDNGYLTRTAYDVVDDYFSVYGVELKVTDVRSAIDVVRTLEPVGVGAVDTQDCLLMQLSSLPQTDDVILLTTLLRDCYKQLVSQAFDAIKSRLEITDEQLKQALSVLNNLNPKPLLSMQEASLSPRTTVIPEFVVTVFEGKIAVSLTGAKLPPLKLSDDYLRMSEDNDAQVRNFARKYIDMANDLIAALGMRQQTMMKIMLAIVNRQRSFFLMGDDTALLPMVLQDIADDTGLDQSTVSRVTSNKYAQTQYGVRSLKSLFTTSAKSTDGESVSRNKVFSILAEFIDAEDKSNPLSDDQLSAMLSAKGYVVKRRTISKYRAELGIGTAQMRKVIK